MQQPATDYRALYRDQQTQLEAMRRHDDEVYRPVLNAFDKFDAQVQAKLSTLMALDITPSEEDARHPRDTTGE
jgi:hypothetical protein